MEFLLFSLLILYLPVWMIKSEMKNRSSPDYWHRHGAVVLNLRALESRGRVIGRYMDCEIYQGVRFQSHSYRFDRIAPRERRNLTAGGELFVDPGIVYVISDEAGQAPREFTS